MDKRKFLRSGAGLLTGVSLANVAQVGVTNAAYEGEKKVALSKAKKICRKESITNELLRKDIENLINKAYSILNSENGSTGEKLNNILSGEGVLNQKKALSLAILNAFKDISFISHESSSGEFATLDGFILKEMSYAQISGRKEGCRDRGTKFKRPRRPEKDSEEIKNKEVFINLINILKNILDSDKPLDYCKSVLEHKNLKGESIKDKPKFVKYSRGSKEYVQWRYWQDYYFLKHEKLMKHIIRIFGRMEEKHLSYKALSMFLEALLKFSVERSLIRYGVEYRGGSFDFTGLTYYRDKGHTVFYTNIDTFYKDKIKALNAVTAAPEKLPLGPLGKVGSYLEAQEKNLLHNFTPEEKKNEIKFYEQID